MEKGQAGTYKIYTNFINLAHLNVLLNKVGNLDNSSLLTLVTITDRCLYIYAKTSGNIALFDHLRYL
jgi:hypothetical protein